MKDDLASFRDLKNQIYVKIDNEDIRNHISNMYESLNEKMEYLNVSDNIKIYDYRKDTLRTDILDILLSRYKDKVIYIDNWASWCGPCVAEMPYSVKLQRRFMDKEIVFVFLCIADNYPNDRAKAIISEKQLTGEHYFMNFYQSFLNQNRFESKGFPRYMIINKEGEIVDNDAPRPSSNKIDEMLNELLSLP